MSKSFIVKNTTSSVKKWGGVRLEPGEQTTVEGVDIPRLLNDESFVAAIEEEGAILNDGESDISPYLSLAKLKETYALATVFESENTIPVRSNGFQATTVQEAIEEARSNPITLQQFMPQFQHIGKMNYSQYLYANIHGSKRSGSDSTGYKNNNCAPLLCPFNGKVVAATIAVTGVAITDSTPDETVSIGFELWKVGFEDEGSKLGDISLSVDSSSYNIGAYWDSSVLTAFADSQSQIEFNVTKGDLLGLKFIRQYGSGVAVSVDNVTIVIRIEETIV